MKKYSFFGALMLLAFCAAAQKIHLFNGKNLAGWKIYGTELWYVEKGKLVSESGPEKQYGYLSTTERYDNFELSVRFKQQANGNSGLFFRSKFEGIKVSGWQVEIAQPGQFTGGIYESYGRGWLIKPDSSLDHHLKFGRWNTLKIKVFNGAVTTWLNGNQMIFLQDDTISKGSGHIALQIHDGGGIKIYWKKLDLKIISN